MIPVQIKCTSVELSESELLQIESTFHHAFDRLSHFIREAQLTLRDVNGPRGGVDKLCTIQLSFYPRGLAVVKSTGTSLPQAANTACDKMQQVAARRLGRRKSASQKRPQIEPEEEAAHGIRATY